MEKLELEVGKFYIDKEGNRLFFVGYNQNNYAVLQKDNLQYEHWERKSSLSLKEYQEPEPDIFEGIKEGDIVLMETEGNIPRFYGYIYEIDNQNIVLSICEKYPDRAYEKICKESIKSIQKLEPKIDINEQYALNWIEHKIKEYNCDYFANIRKYFEKISDDIENNNSYSLVELFKEAKKFNEANND